MALRPAFATFLMFTACKGPELVLPQPSTGLPGSGSGSVHEPLQSPPPDVWISEHPSGVVTGDATITFVCSQESCATVCAIDGGDFTPCTSPFGLAALSTGRHQFSVRAQSAGGDAGPAVSVLVEVDVEAPSVVINSAPDTTSMNRDATVSFSCSRDDCAFVCKLDDFAFVGCSSPWTVSGLGDGAHSIQIQATDPHGRQSAIVSHGWSINLSKPAVVLTATPPLFATSATGAFSFRCNLPPCTFECSLDNGAFGACNQGQVTFPGLAQGPHNFRVRTVEAGSAVEPRTFSWVVDSIQPNTVIDSAPANPNSNSCGQVAFHCVDASTCTTQCQLDGGSYASCTSPINLPSLPSGSHTVNIVATDAAGNVDATPGSATWVVQDSSPPETYFSGVVGATSYSHNASFSFYCTDGACGGCTMQCNLDGQGFLPCTSPFQRSVEGGSHSFQVRSIDPSGLVDPTPLSHNWVVEVPKLYLSAASGSDSYPGTSPTGPKQTFQGILNAYQYQNYDVLIAKGNYVFNGVLYGNLWYFGGYDDGFATRDIQGQASVLNVNSYFYPSFTGVIDGLHIVNMGNNWMQCWSGQPTFRNLQLISSNVGLYVYSQCQLTLQNSVLFSFYAPIYHYSYGGGASVTATNNTIFENQNDYIYSFGSVSPMWTNNLFVANQSSTSVVLFENDSTGDPRSLQNNVWVSAPTGNYSMCYDEGTWRTTPANVNAMDNQVSWTGQNIRVNGNDRVFLTPSELFVDFNGPDNNVYTPGDNNWHLNTSNPIVKSGGLNAVTGVCGTYQYPESCSGLPYDMDGAPRTDPWSVGAFESD